MQSVCHLSTDPAYSLCGKVSQYKPTLSQWPNTNSTHVYSPLSVRHNLPQKTGKYLTSNHSVTVPPSNQEITVLAAKVGHWPTG